MNTNIKFNKKVMLLPLMVLASASSHAVNLAGPWGTAQQEACVKLAQPAYADYYVDIYQRVYDSETIVETTERVSIPAGSSGELCGKKILVGDIWARGSIDVSWRIKDDSDHLVREFVTYSTFDGHGATNDWDINEKGHCAANGEPNGVYLTANGRNSCYMIRDVDDEDVVKATYAVDLGDHVPDRGYPHYDAEAVLNGTQRWIIGDVAYSETTQKLYTCKITNWCNGNPTYYAPGEGQSWEDAWKAYYPERS